MQHIYCDNIIKKSYKDIIEVLQNQDDIVSDIYLLSRIQGQDENELISSTRNFAILLIPDYKIILISKKSIDTGEYSDFIDDVDFLSKKYSYDKIIGRKREWENQFTNIKYDALNILDLIKSNKVSSDDSRKVNLLISLITNCINDSEKVEFINKPKNLLDEIKHKIVLFDIDQNKFIFDEQDNTRKVIVQGLAGTGKTELLIHKMKEKFINNKYVKMAFVCYNNILANDMKTKIPKYFDLLKVSKQIEWNENFFVFGAWGSSIDKYKGLYGYICNYYDIPFRRYDPGITLDMICKEAIIYINEKMKIVNKKLPFDYMFIDESQDLGDSFIKLCELVTEKCMYIAGDIFQNIFENRNFETIEPNYLLNRCYRTDPRTLMFAHSFGLGLQEDIPIRWLNDTEWKNFGYNIKTLKDSLYEFNRLPVRRFSSEFVNDTWFEYKLVNSENVVTSVTDHICCIRDRFPEVQPDDIAIILMDGHDIYKLADKIIDEVYDKFNWDTDKGYLNKKRNQGELFLSNKNNIKGLEFPFVILIITDDIKRDEKYRNTLYMILTRSFITSYLIVLDTSINKELLHKYDDELNTLKEHSKFIAKKPLDSSYHSSTNLIDTKKLSFNKNEVISLIVDEFCLDDELKESYIRILNSKCSKINDKNEFETKARYFIKNLIQVGDGIE